MKEQLVNFETAKLAKEKGIYFKTSKAYDLKGKLGDYYDVVGETPFDWDDDETNFDSLRYTAPTQPLLQKYLRDIHKIHLVVAPIHENEKPDSPISYWYYILDVEDESEDEVFYSTWEQAFEIGLQEALKLI